MLARSQAWSRLHRREILCPVGGVNETSLAGLRRGLASPVNKFNVY